ncbi:MAG TPA: hypothetical protein VH143_18760 [Kofleriaceae bacterium]|jgi:hypothetical protein|nr:hypothetical protein [Kofleriaceae bacterium]
MKIISMLVAVTALAACGDNIKPNSGGDAGSGHDGGSGSGGTPAVPQLGTQIDRLGRPAVNTALNHGFDPNAATAGAAKDAYNADQSPGGWMQYATEFAKNLAVVDALDGVCGDQVLYNGVLTGGGSASAQSYLELASILADDELYVDTHIGKSDSGTAAHVNYLAIELEVASGGAIAHTTCGGRDPNNDVMATTYTALAIGATGFDQTTFAPGFSDGATDHTDLTADFPFLGQPH